MSCGGGGCSSSYWDGLSWHEGSRKNDRNNAYGNGYGRPNSYGGVGGYSNQWGGGGQNDYQTGYQSNYGGGGAYNNQWGGQPQNDYQNNYENVRPNSSSGYMDRWGINRPENHQNNQHNAWGNGPSNDWGASQPPPRPNSYHGGYDAPQGPPPGYYQNQPPSQSHNLHPYYTPNGPPPPQGPRASFPSSFVVWTKTNDDLEEHFCIGTSMDQEPIFSAKRPSASGKVVLRPGPPKSQGPELVRIEGSVSSGSLGLKFPDGATAPVKKKSDSWSFTVNVQGRMQTFTWTESGGSSGGLSSLLSGSKPHTFELVREGEGRPLAKYTAETVSSMSMSSKKINGHFDFIGEAASGQLGTAFAGSAIVVLLKMRHKKMEEKEIKNVMKIINGGLGG